MKPNFLSVIFMQIKLILAKTNTPYANMYMLFCPNKPVLVQLNVSLPTTYKALHIYLSAYAYET